MSDSENEEIPTTDAPEVEEEAPAVVEPPPKKAYMTAEERKAKKKNANSKYYENVRKKLAEAEEAEKAKEEAKAKPKAKRKPKKRTPSPEVVVRRRAPPKRARVRTPSPVSPRAVLRDAYLIMKEQDRERKLQKYRSWFE